jgi:hypothetical protein
MATHTIPRNADPFVYRPGTPDEDTHPHCCSDGLVFLTYTAFDEEIGEEAERLEVVPCRRCAEDV